MKNNTEAIVKRIAIPAVYVLAFFCFLSPPMVHLAELFLLIAMLIDWRHSMKIFQSMYGKVFLLFVPLALLSALSASFVFGYADSQFEQALDYIHMSLFIAAAWAMYRQNINLNKLFIVITIGLLLSLILNFPYESYEMILSGNHRLRIGSIHPIQLGTYLAVIATCTVIWLVSLLFSSERFPRHWLNVGISFVVLIILLTGLILTWTRGPWLGFVLAILFLAIFKLVQQIKNRKILRTQLIVLSVAGLALFFTMILGSLQSQRLTNKIYQDYQVIEEIISGDVDKIPKRASLGWRVHMNVFAWNRFWERPFLGWGPYIKHVIDNSDQGFKWGHLHNSYWEVLLRFGIVGGVLFGAGIAWLLRGVWLDYRNHPDQEPVLLGIYGAFVVLSVWALIDYKFTGWENTAFIWLLGGAAASRALRAKFESSI